MILYFALIATCTYVVLTVEEEEDDDQSQWNEFEYDINNARLRCCVLQFTSHKLENWYCRYHHQKFRQSYNSLYLWLSASAMVYLVWNILEHYVHFDDDYQEFNAHSPAWVR